MEFIWLWILLLSICCTFATREFGQLSDGDWQNEEFWSPLWHQGNWQNLDENDHTNSQQFQAVQETNVVHQPYPNAPSFEMIRSYSADYNQNEEESLDGLWTNNLKNQSILQSVPETQPISSDLLAQQSQVIPCYEGQYLDNILADGFKRYNPEEKRAILEQFIKEKTAMERTKCRNSYIKEMEREIAKNLAVDLRTIYRWKRQFGLSPGINYEKIDKNEFARAYNEIKEQNPGIKGKEVAKMMNISESNLSHRKRIIEQQIPKRLYSTDEKMVIMRKYYQLKKDDVNISETKICAKLKVSRTAIKRWKQDANLNII